MVFFYIYYIMKIVLFENYDSWFFFDDSNIRVHKIKNGPNQGKIRFYFLNVSSSLYSKCSMGLSCFRILDTKYEKNSEIRNITLGPKRFRILQANTNHTIIKEFVFDILKNHDAGELFSVSHKFINLLELKFEEKLKNIAVDCKNLGEVMDNLKKIRNEMMEYIKNDLEEWILDQDTKKYNL